MIDNTNNKIILQICNTDFYVNKFLSPLFISMYKEGYVIDCVCEGEGFSEDLNGVINQSFNVAFPKRASVSQFLSSIHELYLIIKNSSYDAVVTHNRNASIVGRIACFLARKPLNIYTAHGFYFHDAQAPLAYKATLYFEYLLSFTSDHIMSQSTQDLHTMVRLRRNLSDKITVIGNGIDAGRFYRSTDRFSTEYKLSLGHDKYRVMCVGRIVKNKGYADVVEALSKLGDADNIQFVIVGGNIAQEANSVLDELNDLIIKLDLSDKVVITGLVDNVEDYLSVADLFISPSYREGVPRCVLEAQASSLPVIATNIRGNSELVVYGENGYIYEKGNCDQLAEYIDKLWHDPEKANRFGCAGRRQLVSGYLESDYVNKQVNVLNKIFG